MVVSKPVSHVEAILTKGELIAFDKMAQEIIQTGCKQFETDLMENSDNSKVMAHFMTKHLKKVLRKNILGGKMLRGLMVPTAIKSFAKMESSVNETYPENMRLAYALGWILEILQAASLIADDVMDSSETRRGLPCWYKVPGVGLSAVNDSFLLVSAAFKLLGAYFAQLPCYRELHATLNHIVFYTIHGQSLDCHTEKSQQNILDCYTMDRYENIVKYKTSYYTTYMPVICAMIMAGKSADHQLVHQVESIMLLIGHYFQVQDDYLDCFGDVQKTGKVGTDIQDNKCSWLFIKAVELCQGSENLEILVENYGRHDVMCVETVKKLYVSLGVMEAYKEYEEETYTEVAKKLNQLPDNIPRDVFHELLRKLYKRSI